MVQRSNGARASCGWCGMRSSASDRDRGGVGGGWGGRGVAWNLGPRERGNFWSPYQHHQWFAILVCSEYLSYLCMSVCVCVRTALVLAQS